MSHIVPDVKYAIVNARGTTCISISDKGQIVGDVYHGRPDQKWKFEPRPEKNFYIKSDSGKFIFVQEVKKGEPVIAGEPYGWYSEDRLKEEGGIRLSPHDKFYFDMDLENGNPAPGTKVQLWDRALPDPNQIWVLLRVA